MNRDLVKILGYGVDTFDFDNAVNYVYEHGGQIVTINPEMINSASEMPEFANVISNADLVVPDGIGVQIGLKLLGHKVKRIPGIELGKALIIKFSKENKRIAFVGAKPEVIKSAVDNLKNEIQNLNVVYAQDGYFKDENLVFDELTEAKPDLVLTALGSPKQEFFNAKLKDRLSGAVLIGLGGSFDVWAGVVDRAPVIWQRLGLEWLYRTLKEPKRFKRIFPTLPLFILRVLKERLINK